MGATIHPQFIEAARPCRHGPGDRWFVDETYVKVSGYRAYLSRAAGQHGQVIDALLPERRDLAAAGASSPGRCALARSWSRSPPAVLLFTRGFSTDCFPRLCTRPGRREQPLSRQTTGRLRPMRGLERTAQRIPTAGHAFVQNPRRGHYDIATDAPSRHGWASPSPASQSAPDQRSIPIMIRAAVGWHNPTVHPPLSG